MATGPAFDDAVAIAHANPGLGVGCHIVLTDGVPASNPESIPTLLGPDRKTFRPSLVDFLQALLRGKIREEEIRREALAPNTRSSRKRWHPHPHLDTHKHTHLFPAVSTRPLLQLAEQYSIPRHSPPIPSNHGALLLATATAFAVFRSTSSAASRPASSASLRFATRMSSPPTEPSASPPPATSTARPCARYCMPCLPRRQLRNSSVIRATTTATSTASHHPPCALIATSNAPPLLTRKYPRSLCIQTPHNSSTMGTSVHNL